MSDIIPGQETGTSSDTSSVYTARTEEEARELFRIAARRLLHVSNWKSYYSSPGASFTLIDGQGRPVDRAAEKGDYFQIDLPAPGPAAGKGHDWVQIEAIETFCSDASDAESVAIRVRPSQDPRNNKNDIAHFFDESATSSFMVARQGKKLVASVHGRNEKPNTDTASLGDKIRNTITALGAMVGLSKLQWKKLTEGLLDQDHNKEVPPAG